MHLSRKKIYVKSNKKKSCLYLFCIFRTLYNWFIRNVKQLSSYTLIPVALIGIFLYFLNNFFLKSLINIEFFTSYFNDILFPLVYLPVLKIIQFFLEKMETIECLTLRYCIIWAAIFSIWFEFITPFYQPKVTADLYDVISYFVGAILLYSIEKIIRKRGFLD